MLNFAPHRWWLLIAAVNTPGLSTVMDSYRTVTPISEAFLQVSGLWMNLWKLWIALRC